MRAYVFNPYWDSLGGGERYVASFIDLLLDQGWQVDVKWPNDISGDIKNRFGIDISHANFVDNHSLYANHYSLVFWLSDGSLPTSFAAKTIVHFQFPFQNVKGKSISNQIKSHIYKFVVNSKFTKQAIDKEFGISSTVIYPPIDTSKFVPSKKENIIFYIGRFSNLTQRKGQDLLIKSFKNMKLPSWKLVLAGGLGVGADHKYMQSLKKLALNSNIDLLINPSFSEIQRLCSIGKIFWSASGYDTHEAVQTEHFGITVVEAMSAGAVPIITNLGGHPEIVTNNLNGFLWNTPSELEKITNELIANDSQLDAIGQAAITRSKIFDINHFDTEFLKLI